MKSCEKLISIKKITVYGIGEIKKHVLKQKITLEYIKQCISMPYALNS